MPIYEFYCPDNHRIYSFYARSLAYKDSIPRCPENPNFRMEKLLSRFAFTGRAKEPGSEPLNLPPDELTEARATAIMSEMEREFASLDGDNPDPKRMGQLMRRVTDLTGEKLTPELREVMRRLEEGEDLAKLEEEYADLPGIDDGNDFRPPDESEKTEERRPFRRSAPIRDSKVYEMRDFLESPRALVH